MRQVETFLSSPSIGQVNHHVICNKERSHKGITPPPNGWKTPFLKGLLWRCCVDDKEKKRWKAKGIIPKRVLQDNKARQVFRKRNIRGVINTRFSEKVGVLCFDICSFALLSASHFFTLSAWKISEYGIFFLFAFFFF